MQCNKKSRGDSTFRFSQQHLVEIKKQYKNFRSTQLTLKPSFPNGQNREAAAAMLVFLSAYKLLIPHFILKICLFFFVTKLKTSSKF